MTVRVDRAVADVVPQPEGRAESADARPRFEELERLRELRRRLACLEARTRAEDFDD